MLNIVVILLPSFVTIWQYMNIWDTRQINNEYRDLKDTCKHETKILTIHNTPVLGRALNIPAKDPAAIE